ncbi:hypothetical protein CASFOL_042296 [Castilleja foliolosa]|uniref:IP5PC-F beta-propeller domain-containing protein n=1 Tax=Castilleja foliolosa TaxID=1961234 RepID=A0ABD3BBG0_9LAMI
MEGMDMSDGGEFDESRRLPRQPLPEFMGIGGGVGVYKVPNRAAVHPNRPPCLQLGPHPLRETQGGKFLRTIASTETQLWAGQESGLRVWNYSDAYESGTGPGSGKKVPRGDGVYEFGLGCSRRSDGDGLRLMALSEVVGSRWWSLEPVPASGLRAKKRNVTDDEFAEYMAKKAQKRAMKNAKHVRSQSVRGYSNDSTPFGDSNLYEKFVWRKKIEKDVIQGVSLDEFSVKAEKKR